MRRHTIRTTKIFALAVTATIAAAGCASGPAPTPATSATVQRDVAPSETPVTVAPLDAPQPFELASADAELETATDVVEQEAPNPPPSAVLTNDEVERENATRRASVDEPDPHLLSLRNELMRLDDDANAKAARNPRYRPLCDADGYPLVGNVLMKSGTASVTELCRAVRADMKARS